MCIVGVGISAGLDSLDLSQNEPPNSSLYSRYSEGLAQELAQKDFIYVHAGLTDEVLHSSDVKTKVQAVEQFDRDMVGPLLQELEKHKSFRLLVICDSGLPFSNVHPIIPPMYAFSDGPLQSSAGVKSLDEVMVKAQTWSLSGCDQAPSEVVFTGDLIAVALIVQKYGGTSVGTIERIHHVADRSRALTQRRTSNSDRALGHERRDRPASQARPSSDGHTR